MTYVKLDDGFFRNPKVVGIGAEARLLYLAGLCYCSSSLTDGLIPGGAVRVIAAECEVDDRPAAVAHLLDAGLWIADGASYRVHDYLNHNRSKAEIEALSAKRAEVGRLGGRPPKQTETKPKPNSLANGKQNESKNNPDTDTDTDTEKENTPLPPKGGRVPSSKKPKAVETTWPDDFTLSDPERATASRAGIRPDRVEAVFARFRDRAIAKGLRYASWPHAWSIWVNSEYQDNDRRPPTPIRQNGLAPREDPAAAATRAAALESDLRYFEKTDAPAWKIERAQRDLAEARQAAQEVTA